MTDLFSLDDVDRVEYDALLGVAHDPPVSAAAAAAVGADVSMGDPELASLLHEFAATPPPPPPPSYPPPWAVDADDGSDKEYVPSEDEPWCMSDSFLDGKESCSGSESDGGDMGKLADRIHVCAQNLHDAEGDDKARVAVLLASIDADSKNMIDAATIAIDQCQVQLRLHKGKKPTVKGVVKKQRAPSKVHKATGLYMATNSRGLKCNKCKERFFSAKRCGWTGTGKCAPCERAGFECFEVIDLRKVTSKKAVGKSKGKG